MGFIRSEMLKHTQHTQTTEHRAVFWHGPGPGAAELQWETLGIGNLSQGLGEIRWGGKEMGCWLELALGAAESLPVQLRWLPDSLMERVEASLRPGPPSLTLM